MERQNATIRQLQDALTQSQTDLKKSQMQADEDVSIALIIMSSHSRTCLEQSHFRQAIVTGGGL